MAEDLSLNATPRLPGKCLKPQVRSIQETPSIFTTVRETFFGKKDEATVPTE
jgi:hypothetical protein